MNADLKKTVASSKTILLNKDINEDVDEDTELCNLKFYG